MLRWVARGDRTPALSQNRTWRRVGSRRVAACGTFPTPPPQTGHDPFSVIRLSSAPWRQDRFRLLPLRLPPHPSVEHLWPFARLSRPRTTTATPSPWASRPVGDPVFGRIERPSVTQVPRSTPWTASLAVARREESSNGETVTVLSRRHRPYMPWRWMWRSIPGVWGSGNPALTLSRGPCRTTGLACSPASRFSTRLLSLKVFTIRSDRWPGSISPNFPCLRQGFNPPLSRRTVARHPAQASAARYPIRMWCPWWHHRCTSCRLSISSDPPRWRGVSWCASMRGRSSSGSKRTWHRAHR